ncbi:hypothetical protein C8R43DRAFT_1140461 [Mycena crocata]|nr:hypothetical protein C8R43DRAFT_1140461 [Mycena crocata]
MPHTRQPPRSGGDYDATTYSGSARRADSQIFCRRRPTLTPTFNAPFPPKHWGFPVDAASRRGAAAVANTRQFLPPETFNALFPPKCWRDPCTREPPRSGGANIDALYLAGPHRRDLPVRSPLLGVAAPLAFASSFLTKHRQDSAVGLSGLGIVDTIPSSVLRSLVPAESPPPHAGASPRVLLSSLPRPRPAPAVPWPMSTLSWPALRVHSAARTVRAPIPPCLDSASCTLAPTHAQHSPCRAPSHAGPLAFAARPYKAELGR